LNVQILKLILKQFSPSSILGTNAFLSTLDFSVRVFILHPAGKWVEFLNSVKAGVTVDWYKQTQNWL
jgi:hypothetical protein